MSHYSNRIASSNRPPRGQRAVLAGTLALLVSGCGWVDATGLQGEEGALDTQAQPNPIAGSTTLQLTGFGAPLGLLEAATTETLLARDIATIGGWQSSLTTVDGAAAACAAVDDFDAELAASELQQACSDNDDCTIGVEEFHDNGQRGFRLSVPELRAPIALAWSLANIDLDGVPINLEQTLCLLSINEAPLAVDDEYRLVLGERLVVRGDDEHHLLANDSDDDDVRNEPLTVNTTVLEPPQFGVLELGADGSFIYTSDADALPDANGERIDRFRYQISDGMHVADAVVTLEIVEQNSPPRLSTRIPDISLWVGLQQFDSVSLLLDNYFNDPDGTPLSYTISPSSLPPSGHFAIDGAYFSGRADNEDVGRWRLTVEASDGFESVSDTFSLTINGF